MSNYLIAIGGTGNKILEAMVYACAADALYTRAPSGASIPLEALHTLIVDVDASCGNTTRAKRAAEHYETVRAAFDAASVRRRGFHTALSVEQWNMNLAKRATSIAGVTQNRRQDRLLADALFSRTEAELEYSEGFRGHPDLGVMFFADLLQNLDLSGRDGKPDEMVNLIRRMEAEVDRGETVRVMLAGSIFGGTGASGIPGISRFLRERFRTRSDRFILSALLMLPYYEVPPATVDETMEIVVKSSAFLDKARTALQYYGMEGMIRSGETDERGVYDALYLLGLPKEAFVTARMYSTGSQSQENDAHLLEWIASRFAASFYRTGFRGADAGNINCYYYQWHGREISWDVFDEESVRYRIAYGGLVKAAALYACECYPTLRACMRAEAKREARTVNYWTAYFADVRRYNATQRAALEKLIDAFYKLLAFYSNWMWQVLHTLPPTLRPAKPGEAETRELAADYRALIDARAALATGTTADGSTAAARDEAQRLNARVTELTALVGGQAYLTAVRAEKDRCAEQLEARRLAYAQQEDRVSLWEGEDAHLIHAQALRREQGRLDALRRAQDGMETRLALVEEDELRAVERQTGKIPATLAGGSLPLNGLFQPEAMETLHRLLTLSGTDEESRDRAALLEARHVLWHHLQRLIEQRVPDRVTAPQAVAGLGGGRPAGAEPQAAFASFAAALLSAVVEEESL